MRVIAGKAKGHILLAPKGLNTRPIPAMIKEALFSIWQTRIVGSRFLDLFAGSGSMGIEAMSRGARQVVFVEKDCKTCGIIRKNLAACKLTGGYEVYQDDVFKRIGWLKEKHYCFDIIYLDPPFTVEGIFLPVMEVLSDRILLAEDGIIVIRTRKETEMPDVIGALQRNRIKTYGISSLHFYI